MREIGNINNYSQYSSIDNLVNLPIQDIDVSAEEPSKEKSPFDKVLKKELDCNKPKYALDCDGLLAKSKDLDKELEEQIQLNIQNIVNGNTVGYKKIFSMKDENGNYMVDHTPGKLLHSNRPLDFFLNGEGEGFELVNGGYTRFGRLKLNKEGKLITEDSEELVKIEYAKDAPTDWSLKELKATKDGKIYSEGKYLGKFSLKMATGTTLDQGYIERSNVNVPMEIIDFNNKMRLIDVQRSLFSSQIGLDKEAVSIAKNSI